MATFNQLLFLAMPFVIFGLVVTFIAHWRGIPILSYWSGPLGAAIPWVLATLTIIIAADFVKGPRGQAAAMIGLFPMFGTIGVFLLGTIVSIFIGPQVPKKTRFFRALYASAVPAILGVVFLLYIMFSGK
jgi:hypothetical protein